MDWNAAFGFKTSAQLLATAKAKLAEWGSKLILDPGWGTFYDVVKSVAWLIEAASDMVTALLPQAWIQNSSGDYTDEHAVAYGLARTEATKAQWLITFTRSDTASALAVNGTWVSTATNSAGVRYRFRRIEEATASVGQTSIDVLFEAELAGEAYNVGEGTITVMDGFTGWTSCTNASREDDGFVALYQTGTEAEEDASLIARCLARWDEQGALARSSAYVAWALEAAPTVQVSVVKGVRGAGTLDLIVTGSEGTASATQVAAIQAAIENKQAATDDVLVRSIIESEINITATLYLVNGSASRTQQAAIATACRERIIAMFAYEPVDGVRRFEIGEYLRLDRIRGEVFEACDAVLDNARSRLVFATPSADAAIASDARWKLGELSLSISEEA